MVETLSTILLTSSELCELRATLKELGSQESCQLFCCLYQTWCHSQVRLSQTMELTCLRLPQTDIQSRERLSLFNITASRNYDGHQVYQSFVNLCTF